MVRRGTILILGVTLLLALAPGASAQTVSVAQLTGTVTDQSGGTLPGAEVTVTQSNTGQSRFVITGTNGGYVFLNLPVGPYKLTAKMPGFSAFEQTGIVLSVGESRTINVAMKIGAMSETVKVEANALLVESRKVSVANVVDQEGIGFNLYRFGHRADLHRDVDRPALADR